MILQDHIVTQFLQCGHILHDRGSIDGGEGQAFYFFALHQGPCLRIGRHGQIHMTAHERCQAGRTALVRYMFHLDSGPVAHGQESGVIDAAVAGRGILVFSGILFGVIHKFLECLPGGVRLDVDEHSSPYKPGNRRKGVDGMVRELFEMPHGHRFAAAGNHQGVTVGCGIGHLLCADGPRCTGFVDHHQGLTEKLGGHTRHNPGNEICGSSG